MWLKLLRSLLAYTKDIVKVKEKEIVFMFLMTTRIKIAIRWKSLLYQYYNSGQLDGYKKDRTVCYDWIYSNLEKMPCRSGASEKTIWEIKED